MGLCYQCFQEKGTSTVCPFCGYDPSKTGKKYPLALKPGTILNGRYSVGRVLGQGGFGITYLAFDDKTKQRIAIKEYFPSEYAGRERDSYTVQSYSGDREEYFEYGKTQFLEEARTLAEFIGDEHIVRVYSYFEENNTAYFAMEYVEGPSLEKYMAQKGGRLSVEETASLLLPLMGSLGHVHEKGIVHRDVSPDNILIEENGNAKLIDFGAARHSTGEMSKSLDVVVKHGFAPKEQYTRHGRQGPYTDVYAMAATFYYAITGKILPESVDRMEEDELITPSTLGVRINRQAEDVLYKALEVSYRDRYQTMEAFCRDLQEAIDGEHQNAAKDLRDPVVYDNAVGANSGGETTGTWKERIVLPQNTAAIILGCMVLLALLVAANFNRTQTNDTSGSVEESVVAAPISPAQSSVAVSTQPDQPESGSEVEFEGNDHATDNDPQFDNQLNGAQVGDIITFGSYEQDNNTANGKEKIEWLVLEKETDNILVISKYALDSRSYHDETGETTWETCSLRSWLNDSFLREAFTKREQSMILTDHVRAEENPYWGWTSSIVDPGNDTLDQIFLPSLTEIFRELNSDTARQCKPTNYAIAQGCTLIPESENCNWWLRTPGVRAGQAAFVTRDGQLNGSDSFNIKSVGIRPTMRIALASKSSFSYETFGTNNQWLEARVGDEIIFGSFEQDNDTANGKEDIEWQIIEKESGKFLVISKYALDFRQYDLSGEKTAWENSELRDWLNNTFLETAFSELELAMIQSVTISADDNKDYHISAGKDTLDRVFLLSSKEADMYFFNDYLRKCEATKSAIAKKDEMLGYSSYNNECEWWLRTQGKDRDKAVYVSSSGYVSNLGRNVDYRFNAVRPAMWIDPTS